jgi:hypothetical protein
MLVNDDLSTVERFEVLTSAIRDCVREDIAAAVEAIRDEQSRLIEEMVTIKTADLHKIVAKMVDEFLRNLEFVQTAARQMVASAPTPIVHLPPNAIRVEVGQPAVNITTPASMSPPITFSPSIAVPAAQVNLPRLERSLKRIHKDELGERSFIEEVFVYSDDKVEQPKPEEKPEVTP